MSYNADFLIEKRKKLWEKTTSIEEDRRFRELIAEEILTSEDLRDEVINQPEKLIELAFTIVDKNKKTVPFFLNAVQEDFAGRINRSKKDFEEGKLLRLLFLVLKGRQQGFTSFITAYQLAAAITSRNFEGYTLADIVGNAQTIFENKAKVPFALLPDKLRPAEKFNNKKELRFEKLNSAWEVAVASNNVGRSRTINFFHGSEAAFWTVPMTNVDAALRPALTKDCIIIYETTANGFNDFKDMWDSGEYINCFYEWYRTPEYNFKIESKEKERELFELIDDGSSWIAERLRWLQDKGLKKEQIYWYYVKFKELGEKVKQEYPCTPEEAFLMSGSPVFDIEKINARIDFLRKLYEKKPYKQGYFSFKWENPETEDRIIDSSVKFIESDEKPWVRIYREPDRKKPYVIGGDTKGEGKDYYAATVADNITSERVATLHINTQTSKPYTHQVYCLGIYYNKALIGIEINFNTAPIEELQRLRYPRQYVRRLHDNYKKPLAPKYGWKTDGTTRPLIIDKYGDLIINNIECINDIETLKEAATFVYDENGRPDAIEGKHDDLLFSDMICNHIREQQTFREVRGEEVKEEYTSDMLYDYRRATPEQRKEMIKRWGSPK